MTSTTVPITVSEMVTKWVTGEVKENICFNVGDENRLPRSNRNEKPRRNHTDAFKATLRDMLKLEDIERAQTCRNADNKEGLYRKANTNQRTLCAVLDEVIRRILV